MGGPRLWSTLLMGALSLTAAAGAGAVPRLVASTPPIHSLVVGVAGDRAAVELLVPGGRSPHGFALAPSDARALARADLVFTVGGAADEFLRRPLAALAGDARVVRMVAVADVRRLPARAGGAWDTGAEPRADHEGGHEHGPRPGSDGPRDEGTVDPHVWLDPHNAIAFTHAVAAALAQADPEHARPYRDRAAAQVRRLQRLDARLRERLAPVADRPYLVFHDAYQYFEARYGLAAAGAIAVDPRRPPGARRLGELQQRVSRLGIACLFTEPQFEPRIARVIASGTGVRMARLDPLGAELRPGAPLYAALLSNLADSLIGCLEDRGTAAAAD